MDKAKYLICVVLLTWVFTVYAQDTCDFEEFESRINMRIKEHMGSSAGLKFVPIGNFVINSHQGLTTNSLSGTRPFIFVFAPGRTFRFYVVTQETDAQVKLLQHADGLLKKKESLTLFETTQKGDQTTVGYYDYYLEEENEFQLLFLPGTIEKGCALMKFVELAPLNQ